MDDKVHCFFCVKQKESDFPHEQLKLISRIPQSTIYRCKCCNTFWICDVDTGWDELDTNLLWDKAL